MNNFVILQIFKVFFLSYVLHQIAPADAYKTLSINTLGKLAACKFPKRACKFPKVACKFPKVACKFPKAAFLFLRDDNPHSISSHDTAIRRFGRKTNDNCPNYLLIFTIVVILSFWATPVTPVTPSWGSWGARVSRVFIIRLLPRAR